jgi:outer membrane protein assembly factor BamD
VLSKSASERLLALALVSALAVSGCSTFKKKTPTLAYEERPVELLYSTGAADLDRHQWNDAVNYFREVERQHPYSEWARRAILMTAYAHYEANNYAEAIADANRFIVLYPGNVMTPYAFYLKAVCYFEQIVDVGRDQAATEQAKAALSDIVKRYPQTEYAVDSKLKYEMVEDQLAGKEMTIGRWYLRNNDPIAAIGRFRNVVSKYQTTTHAPEALYRLVEAYLTLGLVQEAKENAAVLGYNYPGDVWYRDAYKLMTERGLRPSLAPSPEVLPHLPFTPRRDPPNIAPPPIEVADAGARPVAAAPGDNITAPPPLAVAPAAAGAKAPAAPKPKVKKDLVHGILGL